MAEIGNGYGSECHLLRYLGRHRQRLDKAVLQVLSSGSSLEWLDFPFDRRRTTWQDAEWKGLDFLAHEQALQASWAEFWPQSSGIMNWDAVGWVHGEGTPELLLVEAKANIKELRSRCGAKPHGGRPLIESSLKRVKADLGVPTTADWLTSYYQYANRLAALWFLTQHGVPARLLFVYFTGDKSDGSRSCPADPSGWDQALAEQAAHLGLPKAHRLADRTHTLFLPVGG